MSTLTAVIQAGVITDGFLSGVLESVKDSDNNFFRNFFLDSNDILCYQRPEDVRARVCTSWAMDLIIPLHQKNTLVTQ